MSFPAPDTAMEEPRQIRTNLRILVVDDDETDLRAARRQLQRAYPSATLDPATSATEALERIASTSYDCVLLDYYLPDAHDLSLVRRIQAISPNLPVIMFTGRGDEDIAVELMKAGVADYIPKASVTPERLAAAVRHGLALAQAAENQSRTEAELRAQGAMFHALADTIPHLAWMMNTAGERTWFNQRWFDYTGATADDMRGSGWQKIHDPARIESVEAGIRRSLDSGLPWEETVCLRGRDGTYRWFLARAMPLRREDGTLAGWFGTDTDITERLAAEQVLRDSEARLRRALDIETVGVIFFDTEGAITHANDAFLRLLGLSRDDVAAGRVRWDQLTPPEWVPQSQLAVEELKTTGRTTPFVKEYFRNNGERCWVLFAAQRLNERECVGFVVDMTAQKQAEAEAHRLAAEAESAVAAKNRFLAATTHDMRQPLQILMAAHRRMTAALKGDPDLERWLAAAELATRRLIDALDQLDLISRLESGVLVPERRIFAIQPLLSELVDMAGPHARDRGLELVLQPCDALVESDPHMLLSILENLVGNAIKYTEQGMVTIACHRRDTTLLIEISDTGGGIPAEKLDEIFHEYIRLDRAASEGLGLGLAIVARQAEMLGHLLQVDSTVGVGSCFRIEIPLAAAAG